MRAGAFGVVVLWLSHPRGCRRLDIELC